MEKVKLYVNNSEFISADEFTLEQAKNYLRERGYKIAFTGRAYYDNQKTIIGINDDNTYSLETRRQNGLRYGRQISL